MFLPKYHLKNLIVLNKEQITFYLIFNRSLIVLSMPVISVKIRMEVEDVKDEQYW